MILHIRTHTLTWAEGPGVGGGEHIAPSGADDQEGEYVHHQAGHKVPVGVGVGDRWKSVVWGVAGVIWVG